MIVCTISGWDWGTSMPEPKRRMKDMTFTVIVRVPLDMGIQQVTKNIRTGIGFGDPHITFEHTIIDPKPIEDVPLPSDDEPS